MAKIFKISGYLVDVDDNYTLEDMDSLIFNGWGGLEPRHEHAEVEEIKDWRNNHPLLNDNCDLADCEKYFKRKVPVDNDRSVMVGQVYRHFKGNNTELIERLVKLERSMVERRNADIKAFKEKQKKELVDYELKETWESNGYSQALVDVRNILRGELQNDEGVEDNERQ